MSEKNGSTTRSTSRRKSSKRAVILSIISGVIQFVVVIVLIGGGIFAAYWFNTSEGTTQAIGGGSDEVSRQVIVDIATRGTSPVRVRAMGTVMAAREIVVRPQVSGQIIDQSDAFEPGGFFAKNAVMVQIDPTDYEQSLLQRESELARAQAALQIELGDQAVAEEELELLEVDIPEINRELILRIPQVNQAKAEVRSAEAAVLRAQVDLDRTTIRAPFEGHIVTRNAAMGNNISVGEALATFVGAERYWIELAVPVSSLRWIRTPEDTGGAGSPARIAYPTMWGKGVERDGEVTRLVGRLEDGSRLARVLVAVPDPLGRENADEPMLILGAYVNVIIEGQPLDHVCVIDRNLVREGEQGEEVVWIVDETDRLAIRPVTIAYRGPDEVYVTSGLDTGDRIVRTNLTTPVEGMLLRVTNTELRAEAGDAGPANGSAGG